MVIPLKTELTQVKLGGKINKDLRIGFLNMQTDEDVSNEIAASNNTVLTPSAEIISMI